MRRLCIKSKRGLSGKEKEGKSPLFPGFPTIAVCLVIAGLLSPALAFPQAGGWDRLDWTKASVAEVRRLLASTGRSEWQEIRLSHSNDPGRHFPPGEASALLLAACYSPEVGVIQALLERGNGAEDTGPESPLLFAARFNPNPAMIEALVAGGAKIGADLGYPTLARPALTYAAQDNPNPEVVARIIAKGGRVNAKVAVLDSMGLTPLMYAAQYNRNPEVVRELLKAGAKVDLADAMGRTALILAAENGENPEVLGALLAAGAAVNFTSRDYYKVGWTPLMYAASSNSKPLRKIGLLLEAGADARPRSAEGKTALEYALANEAVPRGDPGLARLARVTP